MEEMKVNSKKESTKKGSAKRASSKKLETKECIIVEYQGKQIIACDICAKAKEGFLEDHNNTVIETMEIYIKPEEATAYYVVNGVGSEEYKVSL